MSPVEENVKRYETAKDYPANSEGCERDRADEKWVRRNEILKIYMDDPLLRMELLDHKKIGITAIIIAAISITISTVTLLVK